MNFGKSMSVNLALIGIFLALAISPAVAEPTEFSVDKWHTRIFFEVQSGALVNYVGMFHEFDVEFMFDEEDFSNSHVAASIPISSFETFHGGLNGKLQQEEFFNGSEYPVIEFESTEIQKTSSDTARMTGDLTMHGVTVPVTLDVVMNGIRTHQRFERALVGFSATGTLNRHDFGLRLLPVEMVGAIVKIRIELSAFEGDRVPYYEKDEGN